MTTNLSILTTLTTPDRPGCDGTGLTCAGLCREEGLAAAYAEHGPRLTARALRIVGDPHLADDAVQEAFIRAWRACGTFQPGGAPLISWLLRITANVAVDLARSRSRRPPLLGASTTTEHPAQASRELDNLLVRAELRAAFQLLSPDHRTAVVELVLRDRPPAEVAAELAIHPGTLRTRLHYALRHLQASLALDEVA
jgi:RNA polymerase sigma-70 factor, ECF subfamily